MTTSSTRSYPIVHKLGGTEITVELMEPRHREAVLAFARSLPPHDLLFMRRDITSEAIVDQWLSEIASGEVTTVLAQHEGAVLGYGTVHRSLVPWTDHIAELRVLVAESMRGEGLGRILTHEAFRVALELGVQKMIAQMTVDQQGAVATFSSLGFRPEAILRDHVRDMDGNKHDLLVLGHEVGQFQARRQAYGLSDSLATGPSDS